MSKPDLQDIVHSPLFWGTIAFAGAALTALVLMTALKPTYSAVHREMSDLAVSVRNYYRQKPDYRGLNTELIMKENIAPSSMRRRDMIVSLIGRPVIIGSNAEGDVVMPSERSFMLSIGPVSRAVCRAVSSDISSLKNDPSVEAFIIQNGENELTFGWQGSKTFDELPQEATLACKEGNVNILSWLFN